MNDIKQKVKETELIRKAIEEVTGIERSWGSLEWEERRDRIIEMSIKEGIRIGKKLTIQLKDEEFLKSWRKQKPIKAGKTIIFPRKDRWLLNLVNEVRGQERQKTAQKILKEVQEYLDEIDATFATFLWSHGYEKQMKRFGEKWNKIKQKFAKGEQK